ncbi:DUF4365 domain-containing protein [Saccharothrix algeriensis]|uniref:DUF4365 domain-containing protein n=1 Tax=Saccharothrix algeriensis TaxID=173560 RepID=A0A8T8HWE3_9PSEU|nr:DUF4365 domain-containing protein [Saccharothrix algeriensis]MBM7814380.1 tetratricopeptide (TPR) repeat protein [Saccharothrix algeriensis]QTR02701.1 DUF4365 domain-containing protein [Saccharothrix algeriensis]
MAKAPDHDLGTDLFLLVRDDRLLDLGLVAGVQVKTGESWFGESRRDRSGEVTGWWFRDDDRKHVDYWLAHTLPHLLVLHDLDSATSYWVHVTSEAVVSTGSGAKILVPRHSTVDEAHRDALLAAAGTVRPPAVWEGSAWAGSDAILPKNLLRHALLTPRLVAPHPNAGVTQAIGPEQAVALIVEARSQMIEEFAARHPPVPGLELAGSSSDWGWRFAAALAERTLTGAIDDLLSCVDTADTPFTRAAATAAAAAALLERAQPDQALELLDAALARDDSLPVDHAWLTVQHARACMEIGRIDQAREDAVHVQRVRLGNGEDVTATAIAGVATQMLFNLADWGTRDVQEVITGSDTISVWWRYQRIAAGATSVIDREFTTWSRRSALVFGAEDVANNRLFTASLMASHTGDHAAWRRLHSLNTKQALLRVGRTTDPEQARILLDALRVDGDHKALDIAVKRLVSDGPAPAVTAAATEIDFAHWTRTTAPANLTLLQRGGDVLDSPTASATVGWLLATLHAPQEFLERTTPTFRPGHRLIDTLAAVVPAAAPAEQLTVIDTVLTMPPQPDQLTATSWARVVHALPENMWTPALAAHATTTAASHHDVLRLALLAVAAPVDETARQQLLTEIRDEHSLDALAALRDVTALPDDVVADLISMLEPRIHGLIDGALHGSYSTYIHDFGRALAVLNTTHPEVARWEPLYALLSEPQVTADDKTGACIVLARRADHVPQEVRERLVDIVTVMLDHPIAPIDRIENHPGVLGPAAELATALGHHLATPHDLVTKLLAGRPEQRAWSASTAAHLPTSAAVGVLTVLAQDLHPTVRASAAAMLARLVATGTQDTLAISALQNCLVDTGTLVPLAIADTLANTPNPSDAVTDIRQTLTTHRSARVRATAGRRETQHTG